MFCTETRIAGTRDNGAGTGAGPTAVGECGDRGGLGTEAPRDIVSGDDGDVVAVLGGFLVGSKAVVDDGDSKTSVVDLDRNMWGYSDMRLRTDDFLHLDDSDDSHCDDIDGHEMDCDDGGDGSSDGDDGCDVVYSDESLQGVL